jgi:hypothetical protein
MAKIKDYLETLDGVELPIFLPVAYFIEHTHSADAFKNWTRVLSATWK